MMPVGLSMIKLCKPELSFAFAYLPPIVNLKLKADGHYRHGVEVEGLVFALQVIIKL